MVSRYGSVLLGLALGALSASVGAAKTPSRFDVVCNGQSISGDGSGTPFDMRLSIDAGRKLWCYRDVGCPRSFPILSATSAGMTLLDVETAYNQARLSVNLATGAFVRTTRIPGRPATARKASGVCRTAAYSGGT